MAHAEITPMGFHMSPTRICQVLEVRHRIKVSEYRSHLPMTKSTLAYAVRVAALI